MALNTIIFVATGVSVGLVAGLFWGYVISVIPGHKLIGDRAYLNSMQTINREILNPFFYLIYMGSPLLLVVATIMFFDEFTKFILLLIATVVFVVGQFLVTASQNVPLNKRLDNVDLDSTSERELAEIRIWYEEPWNRWHNIRTIASIIALTLVLIGGVV